MTNVPIFIVLLWVSCILHKGHGLHIYIDGEEQLDNVLKKRVIFNGKLSTLGDIYGDIRPTVDNFDPGDAVLELLKNNEVPVFNANDIEFEKVKHKYAGNVYVPREFVFRPTLEFPTSPTPSTIVDTPTAIAKKIAEDMNRQTSSLTSVIGDTGAGKSVALRKIERALRYEIMPTSFPILVDLFEVIQLAPFEHLTFDYIVKECIPYNHQDLFNNLLEINPKKIVVLLDGMDQLSGRRVDKIFSIVNDLRIKGATVVLSGRANILRQLERQHLKTIVYEIPEMNISEMETYLTNIWKRIIESEPRLFSTKPIVSSEELDRIQDFATAVTQTLYETPFPRTPVTLHKFAEMLSRESKQLIVNYIDKYPVGCLDYVFSKSFPPSKLLAVIEGAQLRKTYLYDGVISKFTASVDQELMVAFYGPQALTRIIPKISRLHNEIKSDVAKSEVMLSLTGEQEFCLMNFLDETPSEFIHSEYQLYFGAQYILSKFASKSPPIKLLTEIFSDSRYSGLLEFINSGINNVQPENTVCDTLIRIVRHHGELDYNIMDNLMRHGFDQLCSRIIQYLNMAYFDELRNYFQTFQRFELEYKYTLGMLPSPHVHPDPNFVKRPLPVPIITSRLGLLFKLHMIESLKALKQIKPFFSPHEDFLTLLRITATQAIPNFELFIHLTEQIPSNRIHPKWYGELLYETINSVGDGCQRIANYLVKRGADPRIINTDGRTLLHAAVQWRSKKFLRYVIEDLHVPIKDTVDNFGRTVFITALDANPYPRYTPPDWWNMMSYLVQHVKLSLPNKKSVKAKALTQSIIPKVDIDSPLFRLLLSTNHVDTVLSNDKTHQTITVGINCDVPYQRYSALARLLPPFSSGLNPDTLALRRNYLLQKLYQPVSDKSVIQKITTKFTRTKHSVSLTEIMVRYRGVNSLSVQQHNDYQRTVGYCFENEQVSTTDRDRILKVLVDNIGNIDDLEDLKYFLMDSDLLENLGISESIKVNRMLDDRLTKAGMSPTSTMEMMSLRDRLLQPRVDFDPIIPKLELVRREARNLETIINRGGSSITLTSEISSSDESTTIDIVQCLPHRTGRSAAQSPICHYSWKEVDRFNDAVQRRVIHRIRVNSDNFLTLLATEELFNNKLKAQQLIDLVKQLEHRAGNMKIITGNFRMLTRDIMRHGSWTAYRRHQRVTDAIIDFWQPLPTAKPRLAFPLSGRTVALYAAASIPLVRGLYATINMCLQQSNDTNNNCLYASSALGLSAVLLPATFVAAKYIPWTIDQFSRIALDTLPSRTPYIVRENIKLMRLSGLKYGARTAVIGLGLVGVGFDFYNIVDMSMMIDQCSRQGTNCPSKEKIDYIISLTFSCVSIAVAGGMMVSGVGFVPGLIIGLALVVLEAFAFGINDVVYYSNTYNTNFDENIRIWLHKIGFQPPPADVQALVQRTNWINHLHQRVQKLLETSNDNIVAYGVGIGIRNHNNIVIAGAGSINMEETSVNNTKGLSRVLPKQTENSTLLCLPRRRPNEVYDKSDNNVADAVYRCDNTFVIAHTQRWKTKTNGRSYIIYDLEYIDRGEIVGSNTLNNVFIIENGTPHLHVIGGTGNISNTYMMQSSSFQGKIIINGKSLQNILDLSAIDKSCVLNFMWSSLLDTGYIKITNTTFVMITINTISSANVHVIGRTGAPDMFTCDYNQQHHMAGYQLPVTIDGGGGQSSSNMDHVIDCKISVMRPFTRIVGSNSSDVPYVTQVPLGNTFRKASGIAFATIEPGQSQFVVTFINSPLYVSSYGVKYIPSNNTLIWKLQYLDSSTLYLNIVPFRSAASTLRQNTTANETKIESVNCVFIDSYFNSTIFPIIKLPADGISTVTIRHFNVFTPVNSSRLDDVLSRYKYMNVFAEPEMHIVTKLTNPMTNETFTIGSNIDDQFYIDANTRFLHGGDGCDIYVLNRESPEYVVIENEASDNVLDTLIITDTICDSLRAERGSLQLPCCDNSLYDVTLSCSIKRTTASSSHIHVVLQNYLVHETHRHLQIYWHGAIYLLLPAKWTQQQFRNLVDAGANNDVHLALVFSFRSLWPTATLTLTSRDHYVIFNVTDDNNPLVAYRSGFNDIILGRKYLDRNSSSFVILQDFFDNNTKNISTEWLQTIIFIVNVNNISDQTIPRTLTANDIWLLLRDTLAGNDTKKQENLDFQEYLVNITESTGTDKIIIEHNNNSLTDRDYKLGVLIVVGAKPEEFHAEWDDDGTSLLLCARNTCIQVKNWCHSIRHRIYRVEFLLSLGRQPIVFRNMDQLECRQHQDNNSKDDQSIEHLNQQFNNTQYQLLLTDKNNDDDNSRLLLCVGSIFAENVAHNSMYRLFGFMSIVEHTKFMGDNCRILFTRQNLETVSLAAMNKTLENAIKKFEINKLTEEDQESISHIRKNFRQINNNCWQKFTASLRNNSNKSKLNLGVASLQILNERRRLLSECTRGV